MLKKLPPVQKVYEAMTAVADRRIHMEDSSASVISSDGARNYTVRWKDDLYFSDDPASYWQGYPGYPVLAVMMQQGRLPYDAHAAEAMSGIHWHALNEKYKRDYDAALQSVLKEKEQQGYDTASTQKLASECMQKLESSSIALTRRKTL